MKIIMVAGDKNTGKSTTLSKNLRDWLLAQQAQEIEKKLGNKEYEGVFLHKGKTVAVQSFGDVCSTIVYTIVKYAHCDFLVSAGNTRISSIDRLVEKIGQNKHNCVIEKTEATDNDNNRALKEITAQL